MSTTLPQDKPLVVTNPARTVSEFVLVIHIFLLDVSHVIHVIHAPIPLVIHISLLSMHHPLHSLPRTLVAAPNRRQRHLPGAPRGTASESTRACCRKEGPLYRQLCTKSLSFLRENVLLSDLPLSRRRPSRDKPRSRS